MPIDKQDTAMLLGCSVLFFGPLALVGLVSALSIGYDAWQAHRVQTAYRETTGIIVDKHLESRLRGGGSRSYRPVLTFRYDVDGRTYEGTGYSAFDTGTSNRRAIQRILDDFTVGESYPVWYDPGDPAHAVLTREAGWNNLWLLFPLPFLLLGFGGFGVLLWAVVTQRPAKTGPTARRTTRSRSRLHSTERLTLHGRNRDDLSHLLVRTRPGDRLRVRLPRSLVIDWGNLCLILFGAALSAVLATAASPHAVTAWQDFSAGAERGTRSIVEVVVISFLTASIWLVLIACLFGIPASFWQGRSFVELDRHPLAPGDRVTARLVEYGPQRGLKLTFSLVRKESGRRRFTRELASQENYCLRRGEKWEQLVEIEIPADAPHSSVSRGATVEWGIHLRLDQHWVRTLGSIRNQRVLHRLDREWRFTVLPRDLRDRFACRGLGTHHQKPDEDKPSPTGASALEQV